jgi:hypothetical protein
MTRGATWSPRRKVAMSDMVSSPCRSRWHHIETSCCTVREGALDKHLSVSVALSDAETSRCPAHKSEKRKLARCQSMREKTDVVALRARTDTDRTGFRFNILGPGLKAAEFARLGYQMTEIATE